MFGCPRWRAARSHGRCCVLCKEGPEVPFHSSYFQTRGSLQFEFSIEGKQFWKAGKRVFVVGPNATPSIDPAMGKRKQTDDWSSACEGGHPKWSYARAFRTAYVVCFVRKFEYGSNLLKDSLFILTCKFNDATSK